MSADQFLGEIRFFPYTFAPVDWLDCNGVLLPISSYTVLFSLLGTYYGGDGKRTFALPNLSGAAPIGISSGSSGVSVRVIGDSGGAESVTLSVAQMPAHTHALRGVAALASDNNVISSTSLPAQPKAGAIYGASGAAIPMAADVILPAGGGQPHSNMQPYLVGRYCIAVNGVFPSRS